MTVVAPPNVRGVASPVRVKSPRDRRSMSRSATRALDVLEFFGQARRPLRAVEIAKMLDMHPSTTNQLLKTMVDSAHLLFNARTMAYLPSPRLAGVSGWIVETYGADERFRDLVGGVQRSTGLITTLTTPNDLFMQILVVATPPEQQTERGLRVSVFGSAVGSAYLSTLGDDDIAWLATRARVPAADKSRIVTAVGKIRARGFADGPSAGDTMWSIAAPLPAHALPAPMVLGISGPPDVARDRRDVLLETLRDGIARWLAEAPDHAL